jgi:hypothetical protein
MEVVEKYAIIILVYFFKSVRYIFRMLYKIIRLIYRLIKQGVTLLIKKAEPHYHKALEKIYLRACKTFDLK